MEPNKRPQPIRPGIRLYDNIFGGLDPQSILKEISNGIEAIIINSRRLHEDVELLIKSGRYASGGFLLATADEEMAKVFILLDMCRVDFERHESILKNLCRAFYDHVAKYAYSKVINFFRPFHDMQHVKDLWVAEITRLWPSDYESGEPDFPHDTYFYRELPLYVDFIEYDQEWHIPDHYSLKYRFDQYLGCDSFSDSKQLLKNINDSFEMGFFSPNSLAVLNDNFKKNIISENDDMKTIIELYMKMKGQIADDLKDEFEKSVLFQIPLYPFVHILR